MNYKHCCVINAEGFYQTVVLVLLEPDDLGQERENIQNYALVSGESLLDEKIPYKRTYIGGDGFVRPRWNGSAWVEGATPQEIIQWEQEHPAPPVPPKTTTIPELEEQITDTQMALSEVYEQTDQQNTDTFLATAEVYEQLLTLQERVAVLEGGE